jgi:hypothetical protein
MVHWLFGMGVLLLGLLMLAEVIVGREIWMCRAWRAYLWPGLAFALGVLMWPVMTFFTNSTLHMLAHGAWAEVMMIAGAVELALVRGKLQNPAWRLAMAAAFLVSGTAFLHHLLGWTLVVAAVFPLARSVRPRSQAAAAGFALTFVVLAVFLYCDRDVAPVFGHISPLAGPPHR